MMPFSLSKSRSHCQARQSRISCKENKSTYVGNNPTGCKVKLYHIDGEIITEGLRCDYLLLEEEHLNAIFIELKGTQLEHAIRQLENTDKAIEGELRNYAKFYRVVLSGYRGPEADKIVVKKFKRTCHNRLIIKERIIEECINTL